MYYFPATHPKSIDANSPLLCCLSKPQQARRPNRPADPPSLNAPRFCMWGFVEGLGSRPCYALIRSFEWAKKSISNVPSPFTHTRQGEDSSLSACLRRIFPRRLSPFAPRSPTRQEISARDSHARRRAAAAAANLSSLPLLTVAANGR